VIDPEARWSVDPASGRSRSRNTPFAGRKLSGCAVQTFVDGREVFRHGA
jgi:dihydroorotase